MEGGEEHSGSNAIITLTSAHQAGWYSNGMKESHFLGRETETETAALALERVSKRGKNTQKVRKSSTVS